MITERRTFVDPRRNWSKDNDKLWNSGENKIDTWRVTAVKHDFVTIIQLVILQIRKVFK